MRLVAGPTGLRALSHGRGGQGRIAPPVRRGLGRTKSTEIIIPDLEKKLQKWQGNGEPPAGEVGKAVPRVAPPRYFFTGYLLACGRSRFQFYNMTELSLPHAPL